MKKYLIAFLVVVIQISCGAKISNNPEAYKNEVDGYIKIVDNDNTLETYQITGALTDEEGFKDVGTFQYTVFFDGSSNNLKKIQNIEITNQTIEETYYFNNGGLIYFKSVTENSNPKRIYSHKGKVISSANINSEEQNIFLSKAKRFQKAFQESHE